MRLPRITQLTQAQKDVYLYAPADKHVLVHGPPGTGKTLIACLRAVELQKKQVPVVLGMFNKVLSRYSANAGDGPGLPSQTILSWFLKWWRQSGVTPYEGPESKIIILAPYEAKAQVKALGARWDMQTWRPESWKPGAWVMLGEQFRAKKELFPIEWQIVHDPPKREGTPWIDWAAVADHISECETSINDEALSLGTLLVDEGQDFPPSFYQVLRRLSAYGQARGIARVPHPLRCFILADQNQQITEENSTLDQIASALNIKEENRYLLLDNFRNSREIALLARAFFDDVGVMPNLPERSSETPTFLTVSDHTALSQRIRAWLINNPGKEAAVFSFNEPARAALHTALGSVVSGVRGRNITLQTYSSKTRAENKAEDLVFDVGDVITVLNLQSCKGLEFDAVFIADIHQAKISQQAEDRFKMQMFVAVSRARESVMLIDSGPNAGSGHYVRFLPGNDILERETVAVASGRTTLSTAPRVIPVTRAVSGTGGGQKREQDSLDWEVQLRTVVRARRLETDDKRSKPGGSYWVIGGMELSDLLTPLGFSYAAKRSAWWRK